MENVTSNAENICKLTHFDPRCVGSCVIVSSIIHALVFEDMILDYEDVIGIIKRVSVKIVLLGGDADTNAAVAGAIFGC